MNFFSARVGDVLPPKGSVAMKMRLAAFSLLVVAAAAVNARYVLADQSPAPAPSPYVVEIKDNAFSPASLTVSAGSTVTWKNEDPYAHTVTMQGANGFDSGSLDTGKTFTETFTTPGTYNYVCSIHPSMTGTITVTKS
jgi:plastocyanin